MTSTSTFRLVAAGDSTLLVQFEARIDPAINARATDLAAALEAAAIDGVRDVVPTYRSVAVSFNPLRTDLDALKRAIEQSVGRSPAASPAESAPLEIPVCYGGEFGPDLSDVAKTAGLSAEEVIAIHAAATYRVFMLGFLPGFAYMGLVDDRIAAPRHAVPRAVVPGGSVGIAGRQTGVYSLETPGGWQIIGRTPLTPFDAQRPQPFLFAPGDAVRFARIDRSAFDRLRG